MRQTRKLLTIGTLALLAVALSGCYPFCLPGVPCL